MLVENVRELIIKERVFIVDADIYPILKQLGWKLDKQAYAYVILKRKHVPMHRLINCTPEGLWTDHINGNIFDNRRENLRSVTPGENNMNRKARDGTTSKYKGVTYVQKRDGRTYWRAKLNVHGKCVFDKNFKTEFEAAMAYDYAANKWHGEFARFNFPEYYNKINNTNTHS